MRRSIMQTGSINIGEPRRKTGVFKEKMVYRRLIFNLIVARRIRKNGYCCQDVVVVHPVRYAISDSFTITPKKKRMGRNCTRCI